MWHLLVKPLVGVAGDVVKGFVEKKKLQSEQKLTKIKAETELMQQQIKGEADWDLEGIKNTKGSWKDEYLTILFSIPLLLCFIPFTVESSIFSLNISSITIWGKGLLDIY